METVVPENVSLIQKYLAGKLACDDKRRQLTKLEREVKTQKETLSLLESERDELFSGVDPSMLVDNGTVKVINELLTSAQHIILGDQRLPVGCALLHKVKGKLTLSVVFSTPVFVGWRTETPYVSYQRCPVQTTAPEPPDVNHIPEYISMAEQDVEFSCWTREGERLCLWALSGSRGLVFMLNEQEAQK